jgi:flagellar hook-associated protein 3 FlgL
VSSASRITERSINASVMANLQGNLTALQRLQEQLSSGRQVNRPSDSPANTGSALEFRADIRRAEQYSRNADDGLGWLGTADNTLTSATEMVNRAHDLLVAAGNGAVGGPERQATAREIDALRDSLLGLANTRYLDRPIFAGTAGVDSAYALDGTYQGNSGAAALLLRTVAPGVSVQVNLDGPTVFGPDAGGLFQLLKDASTHLDANDPAAIRSDMDSLQAAGQRIQDQLATVGALYNRVQTMRDRADSTALNLKSSLSEVEDVDLPKTIVDLQLQETAYQSALSATAKVIQPSLVDFLR